MVILRLASSFPLVNIHNLWMKVALALEGLTFMILLVVTSGYHRIRLTILKLTSSFLLANHITTPCHWLRLAKMRLCSQNDNTLRCITRGRDFYCMQCVPSTLKNEKK